MLLVSLPPVSLTSDDENEERQLDIAVEGEEEKIAERLTLNECLKSLSEKDRAIIEYRYFKGETQTVVAKRLGMTQVQVSRREKNIIRNLTSLPTVTGAGRRILQPRPLYVVPTATGQASCSASSAQ